MKLKVLILAAVTAASALAADSVPLFNAVLSMGKSHRFVLAELDGKPSGWLNLGDTYDGYKLATFDPATSTLGLEKDGKTVKVTLVNAAGVKDGPAPTPATLADAEELFKVMRFDEMMGKLIDQQKKALGPLMQQSLTTAAARMKLDDAEKEEFVTFQKKQFDELMSSMLGPEMRNDMQQAYSEIFTKEEMGGLAAFYSTPAGQALIDKTPAVSAKLQALMMPRMQQGMIKVQQATKEFAAGMAAKHAAAAAAAPAPAPAGGAPAQP
jgi:hypothetical protein